MVFHYSSLAAALVYWQPMYAMRMRLAFSNISLGFSRSLSKSSNYCARSRSRYSENLQREKAYVTELTDAGNANTSLAAHIIRSNNELNSEPQYNTYKKIEESQKVDELFRHIEELAAVKIRPADIIADVRDELNTNHDADENLESVDDLAEEEIGSGVDDLSVVKTAKPANSSIQLYGTPDPNIPISDVPCHGCGAKLHCKDTGIPGYLPSQVFLAKPKSELKDIPCQRCHLLKNYNIALDVSVGPDDYKKIISKIKKSVSLVIVIVDLLDMPQSLYSGLSSLIGHGHPIYIVGNKVDLLPKDSFGYLSRTQQYLIDTCEKYGIPRRQVKHVALISAKTGYGVEDLITKLLDDWKLKGDLYIIGCTNAGKSTLFNDLLASDFCRIAARDIIQRATTSSWPGTTLDLLKFPVVNPKPSRLYERRQRLLAEKSERVEEEKLRRKALKETRQLQYATLMGRIGMTSPSMTDLELRKKAVKTTGYIMPTYSYGKKIVPGDVTTNDGSQLYSAVGKDALIKALNVKREPYDDSKFRYWCFDTPGLVNPGQIISMLTPEELALVLSNEQIRPRVFSLRPNQVLFLSGLARLDCLQGNKFIYCTVLASKHLPVHIVESHEADEFYRANFGKPEFGIPIGDSERLLRIPSLIGQEFLFEGIGVKENVSDIIFSSLGWISVGAPAGETVRLRAFTPGGHGCSIRSPALLPYSVNIRGKRIRGTYTYQLGYPK